MPRVLAALFVALLVTGCGAFTAPPPTAGDHTDIVGLLVRHGISVTTQVSGDPGCTGERGSSLHSNALRYDVQLPVDTNTYSIYVFGWKSEQTFNTDAATFDACAQDFGAAKGATVDTVEHLPWRAFGVNWPPALADAVDAALASAGGIPAPVQPE